jgi:hypothetical protein
MTLRSMGVYRPSLGIESLVSHASSQPFVVHPRCHVIDSFPLLAKIICSSYSGSCRRTLAGRRCIVGRCQATSKGLRSRYGTYHTRGTSHSWPLASRALFWTHAIRKETFLCIGSLESPFVRSSFRHLLPTFALHRPFYYQASHRHSSLSPVVYAVNVAHATTFSKISYISDTAALRII